METFKHEYAKNAVLKWIEESANWKAFTEYPLCVDSENQTRGLWDPWPGCDTFDFKVPTYQQCLDAKLLPLVIFDVVAIRGGRITDVFEIIHKHPISKAKEAFSDRFVEECWFKRWALQADDLLACGWRPAWFRDRFPATVFAATHAPDTQEKTGSMLAAVKAAVMPKPALDATVETYLKRLGLIG